MKPRLVFYKRPKGRVSIVLLILSCSLLWAFVQKNKVVTLYIIGDSTVTDYSLESDYETKRYPQMGWGQVFQQFLCGDSLAQVKNLVKADTVLVDDRAKGGRSTRTFFQEGRWRTVYENLKQGDLVMMQFGHNDQSPSKVLRYTNIEGYKEFLRLYVSQTRQKGGIPIIITPVNRNYPWIEGELVSCHGDYPNACKEVASEMNVALIDLTKLSTKHFTSMGEEYVTSNYFMNLPAGKYEGYPEGKKDNTHFQPEGATAVAQLVFNAMKTL